MKKNMGTLDRVIRTAIAVVFGVLIIAGRVHGTLAIILGVVAAVFLLTSIVGVCPGYLPLKISTCKSGVPAPK